LPEGLHEVEVAAKNAPIPAPGEVHADWAIPIAHVAPRQQTPVTQADPHVEPFPEYMPPAAEQADGPAGRQPVPMQHAPVHGLDEHAEPVPWKAPVPLHAAGVVTVQAEAPAAQQAPVGQAFDAHAVDAPWKVPPAPAQFEAVAERQPVPKQQAPDGCGHVTLPQVVPAPCHVPTQAALVVELHEPLTAQQAPEGCGQGLGEQTELSPWYVPVHAPEAVAEHVPPEAQHAPVTTPAQALTL
jgi:hypothetical protein